MSYFKPYDIYATRLPILKPGHLLKIGAKFYQVIAVRRNRKKVALGSSQTKYRFYTETDSSYESMHGNLNLNRVVHIQYVSIDQNVDTKFYWGTQPLQSKDVEEAIQPWGANLLAPLEVDRWSFDPSMHLYVTTGGAQNFYFEIIEYEVTEYAGTPTRPYLYVMPNGFAIFVEEEETETMARQALMASQRKARA
jgi:hypothetical protein